MFAELLGWAGAALLLSAYGLHTTGRARPRLFHTLNLVGAAGVGLSAFAKEAWPAMALELAWAVIALCGIVACLRPAAGENPTV